MTRQAVQRGQAVSNIVGLGHLPGELFQMLASGDVVAHIHQGNREVVVLFRALELVRGSFQVLIAGVEVHGDAIRQFLAGTGHSLLQVAFGLVKLALLHGAQPSLVVLHSLCKTRILVHWFLGGSFLGHPQNPS